MKTAFEEPAIQTDLVKHFIDASKISQTVLRAIVRTRQDDIVKLLLLSSLLHIYYENEVEN